MACRKPTGQAWALRAVGAGATALACLAAALAGAVATAGASPAGGVGAARSRVAALYRLELREAHTVHALTLAYASDAAVARRLRATAATTSGHLADLRHVYAGTVSMARADAILTYVGGIPTPPPTGPGADFASREAASTYETAALHKITVTMAELAHQQAELTSLFGTYRAQLARALAQESSAAASRRQAVAEAQRLQALMASAQHQLAHAEARAKAATGPPVGNGLVQAVSAQLDQAGKGASTTSAADQGALRAASATTSTRPPTTVPPTTALPPTTTVPPATTARPTTTARPSTTARPTTTVAPTTTRAPVATTTTTAPSTTAPATTTTSLAPSATTTTRGPASTTTTTAPPGTAATAPASTGSGTGHPPPLGGVWLQLRQCESGDDYAANSGNGFYGAYQFSAATWSGLGYPGRPDIEPYWMQDEAAVRLHASDGWSPWPACSAALGL